MKEFSPIFLHKPKLISKTVSEEIYISVTLYYVAVPLRQSCPSFLMFLLFLTLLQSEALDFLLTSCEVLSELAFFLEEMICDVVYYKYTE